MEDVQMETLQRSRVRIARLLSHQRAQCEVIERGNVMKCVPFREKGEKVVG
jgi:hypothetical protein